MLSALKRAGLQIGRLSILLLGLAGLQRVAYSQPPCALLSGFDGSPLFTGAFISAGEGGSLTSSAPYASPCAIHAFVLQGRKRIAYMVEIRYSYFKPDKVAEKCASADDCSLWVSDRRRISAEYVLKLASSSRDWAYVGPVSHLSSSHLDR